MTHRRSLAVVLVACSLVFGFHPAPTTAATPFEENTTAVGNKGATSGSAGPGSVAPPAADASAGKPAEKPQPPALNPPPEAGAKGATTASPEFKTWLENARVFINKWDFPEGVVNKYGHTITRDDYLKAIIWIESNGVHKSPKGKVTRSYVGALGFMQLMPATAKGLGFNASDPGQNLKAGTKYLVELFSCDGVKMAKTAEEKLIKACCAYNAGPYSTFVERSWDQLKMGKNYETIGYGLKLKMCLGLELTPTEKKLVPKVLGRKDSVEGICNEFYSNANGLF